MTRPLSREVRYAIVASIVSCVMSCVLMATIAVMYTNRVDNRRAQNERENDKQWCDLITLYDDQFQVTAPENEIQKKVATYMHNLRRTLGCPR